VKEAVSVPVFANGNVLYYSDIQACLDATGSDGVMSAEGNLYNPAIFANTNPPHADLALEYIEIVKSLKTKTAPGCVKAHLFKLMRPAFVREENFDLRETLGKLGGREDNWLGEFEGVAKEMKRRMDVSALARHILAITDSFQSFSVMRRRLHLRIGK
jgi:tRNA-dihydrouridine synthase 1